VSASKHAMAGHVAEPGSGSRKTGVARAGSKSKMIDRRRRLEDSADWSLSVDRRRELARYLREQTTVVFAALAPPDDEEGALAARELPAMRIHLAPTEPRTAISDRVAEAMTRLHQATEMPEYEPVCGDDGASWRLKFMDLAPGAMLDALGELIECQDLRAMGSNKLLALGSLMSAALRRAVLREVLNRHEWNMPAAAEELGLAGTTVVLRTIKDLGLGKDLERARLSGLVRRGRKSKGSQKKQ